MPSKAMLSWLLVFSIGLPLAAQDKVPGQGVDWEAKMLTTELYKLGDPEINRMLPELYKAIARPEAEQTMTKADFFAGQKVGKEPDLMSLLKDPSIRREIEMRDYQFEELQARNRELQNKASKQIASLLKNSQDGSVNRTIVIERIQEIRNDARREVEETVLPFQFTRLREVGYQVQMRRRGVVAVITSDPLATELRLTDRQRESLKKAAEEIEEELARDIAALRAKAREKLIGRLSPTQQKKLSGIVGSDFDYQEIAPGKKPGKGAAPAKKR